MLVNIIVEIAQDTASCGSKLRSFLMLEKLKNHSPQPHDLQAFSCVLYFPLGVGSLCKYTHGTRSALLKYTSIFQQKIIITIVKVMV